MPNGIPQEPRFFRNVGLLAGASAMGPLVAFAAYPFLTRIFDPGQFGVLGLFEAVLAISLSFCTLRYHLAIPVADDDVDAASLVVVSIASSGAVAVLLAIVLHWTQDFAVSNLRLSSIRHLTWLLPIATFASGSALALAGWHTRRRAFARIAASRICQGLVQVSVQTGVGLMGMLQSGLAIGLVAARVAAGLVLCGRTDLGPPMRRVSWPNLVAATKRHRRLPLISSWSAIINILGQQLSVLIVGASFGVDAVGFYSLAFLVTVGPAHLVSQAIEQSFVARMRDAEREGRTAALAYSVYRSLVRMGTVPAIVFAALAPDLFSVAFGQTWSLAGEFARWLVPSVLAAIVGSHLPSLVVLRHWQRAELVFNVALASSRCVALLWAGIAVGPFAAVLAYGVTGAILTLGYSASLIVAEGARIRDVAVPLLKETVSGLAIGGVLLGVRAVLGDAGSSTACAIGLVVVALHLALAIPRRASVAAMPG